jgi:L-seryl-tRNA(Ser) seleniumtransferase
MVDNANNAFRQLPSVDELLHSETLASLIEREGRAVVVEAARQVLAEVRFFIGKGLIGPDVLPDLVANMPEMIAVRSTGSLAFSLRPVINATGVILHTNLGRAPISEAALDHVRVVAMHYSNLEFDLATGERGKRDVHVQSLLERVFARALPTPVSTVVVNNNAAAVLLAINSLAEGGEVIVSRGELVEIGGSFRIPDVMQKSLATLREVGTTNRTRIADYEKAINEQTRLLLRVHRSNFEIVGFTEQPSLEELVALGRKHKLPVMEDLGSGALIDLGTLGLGGEPNVFDSLRAGVDIVTYSGDKLLGGPQAGLLSGRAEIIARTRANPLFRALRVDKLTYAALEATLLAYLREEFDAIPALRLMRTPVEQLRARAEEMVRHLSAAKIAADLVPTRSLVGGGAAPGSTLESVAVTLKPELMTCDELAAKLRKWTPPVIVRIENGQVLIDLRTVFPEQDEAVVEAVMGCVTDDR